ncbi:hypothetical protein G6F47_007703 [Rhizopus delemar]|nr:hypothetical protein G6F54_008194 [Rhizopus delemar]KAG1510178.1 hypothetical protein G6F53_006876 [Rhizopus delemar]KAG1587188.1 hypothetical protein G6F48_006093 [Rhizopus delemar]KAG1596986.1 hypothetical protein G6F47_007703 [Rhizopus delemar]KAG1641488.1 hypothetical protein G6F44_005782 [Rhizopus delemar]
MKSLRNPLGQLTLERTAAIFTAICIINQLFLVNNGILKLGWVERTFCGTDRAKWDGIIFNVGNRKLAPMLFAFSGGCNDKTSKIKEGCDISKLYSKMVDTIKDLPSVVSKEMYCVRFFDNQIYSEQLIEHHDTKFRNICVSLICPTSLRLLVLSA